MGKAMKVVWPRGKNLKPLPKGRAPLQAIPGPAPRKTLEEKRQDQEYRLALSKGHYPRSATSEATTTAARSRAFLMDWMLAYTWNCGMVWTAEQTERVEKFLLELFPNEPKPMILAMDLDGEQIPPLTVHPSSEVPKTPEVLEYMERVNLRIREMMTMPATLVVRTAPAP